MHQVQLRKRMDVREYLLAEADRMIRANGFEAFTLARLSDRVGIRISTIQGHFASRDELGDAVAEVYASKLTAILATIEKRCIPAAAKLAAFKKIIGGLAANQISMRERQEREKIGCRGPFSDRQSDLLSIQLEWLERTIDQGKTAGEFDRNLNARREARRILNSPREVGISARGTVDEGILRRSR